MQDLWYLPADRGFQRADLRPHRGLRGTGSAEMSALYLICGVVALALFVYLLVALFNAENL
jgi:K+-transporting ATPase KdpF subunit